MPVIITYIGNGFISPKAQKKISVDIPKEFSSEELTEAYLEGCKVMIEYYDHKIISIGKLWDLKDNYSKDHEIIVELQDRNNEEFIKMAKKIPSVKKVLVRQGKVYLYSNKGSDILKRMLAASVQTKKKFNVTSITLSKPSLEEVFESLTGKNNDAK